MTPGNAGCQGIQFVLVKTWNEMYWNLSHKMGI
jgi:hypothetical protein